MSVIQQGPAEFASSVNGTPAVKAAGTNGATGVYSQSDSNFGVYGFSDSRIGVAGESNSSTGVFGVSNSGGIGVHAISNSGTGVSAQSNSGTGVNGSSESGTAVFGQSITGDAVRATTNSGTGVNASSESGTAVFGESAGNQGIGVQGNGAGNQGTGVQGSSNSSTGVSGLSNTGVGVEGSSKSGLAGRFFGDVEVQGNLSATGTKPFVQAHPTDPTREIVYIALEGGEAGTYLRGSGQLQSGKAVLALPDHFGRVTAKEGLTVQLMPRGEWLQLYVGELDRAQLVVREAQGKSGTFDYLIHGVRRGYEQHEVIRTKR